MKKGATVVCKAMPKGPVGRVLRIAHDKSWCDVRWTGKVATDLVETWSKRMRTEVLVEIC